MKHLITYFLPVFVLLAGCSTENGDGILPVNPSDGGVTFVVELPDPATGTATYALLDAEESKVSSVDVLVFSKNSSGNYLFVEHAAVSANAISDGNIDRKKIFNVSFRELTLTQKYCFVVLANSSELLNNKTYVAGTEMSKIMRTFEMSGISKWVSAGKNIPMWGKTNEIPLTSSMKIEGLKLLRMLAKINVTVDEAAQNIFKLKSIRLYNYRKGGYVVPDAGNLADNSNELVKAPTVWGEKETSASNPVVYEETDDLDETQCVNQIYTFETNVEYIGENPDFNKTHALVIGGLYDDSETETYYRVNIRKVEDGVSTYLDLLRNHRYTVNITDVKDKGFATMDEAYKSKGVNMVSEIIDWNDAGMSDVDIEGQYNLSVSKGKWTFRKDAQTIDSTKNVVTIHTDVPGGWTVGKIVDDNEEEISSWLTLSTKEGAKGSTTSTQILLEENKSGETRTGYIHIKAGLLTYKMEVVQSTSVTGISLNKTELTIYPNETETLLSSVSPADAVNEVVWSTSNSGVATVTQDGKITGIQTGTATITVMSLDGNKTATCTVTVGYKPRSHGGWAGSNIYWDGTNLTFYDTGVNENGHNQGVYFKWGSLWGISSEDASFDAASTTMYRPTGAPTINSWSQIPYPKKDITADRKRAYLYEITDEGTGLGDICKYITSKSVDGALHGKKWRMPTSNEMKEWESTTKSGTWSEQTSDDEKGTYTINGHYSKGSILLPASGYRLNINGSLGKVGEEGRYWSSSPAGMEGYSLILNNSIVSDSNQNRVYGFPVRCVVVND